MSRPNILLIVTDQQYAGAMSCAGNPYLSTPAMDRIAAAGTRFERAYCTYPLCIPARESMLTGRMPQALGYRKWGDPIAPEFERQQLGFLFAEAGYDCVYAGKLHTPGGDPSRHGFRQLCGQNDYLIPGVCRDYLAQTKAPFLMVASFDNPHNICEWARGQNLPWGNVPAVPLADCPPLPANFAIPPDEPSPLRLIQRNGGPVYPMAEATPDDWRHYRHAYYRLIEKADAGIGRILDALAANGLADNTVIVFTSDHGDGHGAHRWNQKSILYEEIVRIPMIVSAPGAASSRVDDTHLVSNGLDLLPTLCDYAGIVPPANLPGASLRPLLANEAVPWRDELVIETWPFQGDPGHTLGRSVRTDRFTYIVYSWGRHREQLFDLAADPGQMVSLAGCNQYTDILAEHRDRLRRYCQATGDAFAPFVPATPPAQNQSPTEPC